MNYELLNGLCPKLLDIVVRDESFWQNSDYLIERDYSRLHVLAYVYAGSGMLHLSERSMELKPGMIFQNWPGHRMRIDTEPRNPLHFYSIHYRSGVVCWTGGKGEWREAGGPLPIGELLTDFDDSSGVHQSFQQLYQKWTDKDAGYEWESQVDFLNIVRQIAAERIEKRKMEEGVGDEVVRKAIAYIKSHYRQQLSRNELARLAALSPAYFSSLFKNHTGITPIQYIHKLRLDRAKQLLREGGMPIRQVAEEVGFTDSFYFSRLFTKQVGMSPSKYRFA